MYQLSTLSILENKFRQKGLGASSNIYWYTVFISSFPQVDIMDALFKEHKDHVPLYKNQPPVGGAIYWERSLFQRIKHTIIRFQTMDDMMTSEQGKAVSMIIDI